MKEIWNKLKKQSFLWGVTILTGVVTTFSQYIADNIKSGIDKSQLRNQYFNVIAGDLSKFNFDAESVYNAYFESERNKGIGVEYITKLVNDYNADLGNLRSREYLFRAQINKGWGKKFIFFNTHKVSDFDELYFSIRQLDSTIHLTNPIALNIVIDQSKTYQLTHCDSTTLIKILPGIKKNLDEVSLRTNILLHDLY
ncbi:MAG: hypothetical protein WCO44_12830 [Bacteroidota bacterium]